MIIPALICGMMLTSCDSDNNADGFWLKMGDNSIVHTSDIDFYDVSLHTIHLKKKVSYLENVHGTVSVYVGNKEIYECSIHWFICSHIPMGQPYMWSTNEDEIRILFNPSDEKQIDPRNDKRIIAALKENHLYRK